MHPNGTLEFLSGLYLSAIRRSETAGVVDCFLQGLEHRLAGRRIRLRVPSPFVIPPVDTAQHAITLDASTSPRVMHGAPGDVPIGSSFPVVLHHHVVATLVVEGDGTWSNEDTDLCVSSAHHLGLCLAAHAEILNASVQDPLTGLLNRKYLDLEWPRYAGAARRYQHPISLALIDLDGFREINNRYGHSVGDEVLRRLGRTFAECVRASDVVARYGGDEFAVILPCASAENARGLADRLIRRIRETDIPVDPAIIRLTVSVGLATWEGEPAPALEQALHEADLRLSRAKQAGGNQCAP